MRQLYVCSRPILSSDGKAHRHLIGILSQNDDGEYQFEYKLDDSVICNSLILSIFPNVDKVYNDAETRILLEDYFPSENDTVFMRDILKKSGFKHYDEWEWLKTFESDDTDSETVLYETLPEDVICHIPEITEGDIENDVTDSENWDTKSDDLIEKYEDFEFPDFDENKPENTEDEELDDLDDLNLDELFGPDNSMFDDDEPSVIQNAVNLEKTQPDNRQESKPKSQKTVTTIVKTTVYKRKKTNSVADFIEPPPESPMDILQQRLIENQKKRQEELAKKLKENPYDN